MSADSVEGLHVELKATWAELLAGSRLSALVTGGDYDVRLYALYLLETYHYTRENPRHQALVGAIADYDPAYLRFCLKHALEELGHEQMALHDMRSVGFRPDPDALPEPLPATEVLTAYLYWISQRGNPLARVGYSFWAESSYEHIGPLLLAAREKLGLEDRQMTFLVGHARIDAEHAREVEEVVRRFAVTPADWSAVRRTMTTSLRLTVAMLDAIAAEYDEVVAGRSDRVKRLGG